MFSINFTFLIEILIFLAIVLFVYKYIYPAISTVILDRQSLINDIIAKDSFLEEKTQSVKSANILLEKTTKEKCKKLINQAEQHAKNIYMKYQKQQIIDAKKKQQAIFDKAQRDINKDKAQFEKLVMNSAVKISSIILKREIKQSDHKEIINEMIDAI